MQNNQQNQQGGNNPFNMLGGLMAPNSGFNFANIFTGGNRQPNQQEQKTDPRSRPTP